MQHVSEATLATKVRSLRVAAGLSQQTLASRSDLALRTVARIEAGEEARVTTLQAIARVLGVTVGDLLTDPAEMAS